MRALRDYGGIILSVLASLAASAALYVQYEAQRQDGPIKERLTAVETQQRADDKRIGEIHTDVREIRKDVGAILDRLPPKK